ncbi:unnamed protein product [Lymnaea stagnalis]|uniref:Uncharacterized protein n=1 Tax=Lymnaea stagnalis TaxID=6523 RepID=A0AAV2HJ79_LYMST
MQLITALSETDKECDGQNIPMSNNIAGRPTQPIFSTSNTARGQLHSLCSNVGGSTSSPRHSPAKVVYRPTHTQIKRHPKGNDLNHNHSGGVAPTNELINSPELSLVNVYIDEATYPKRPLSAPAVVLNVPVTSITSLDSTTSLRNAAGASSKLRNENTMADRLQQPQECRNVSEIHFLNHNALELDRSRPEAFTDSVVGTPASEAANKPYIDSYDENMNLSDTVNNNLFLPDEQSNNLRQTEERHSPERSCRTIHISKNGAASQNTVSTCDTGSDVHISSETLYDLNYESTPRSGYWISCNEVSLSDYKNPPIWTSLALKENHCNAASVIVPLPQHSTTRAATVHCDHWFVPIQRPGQTAPFLHTEMAACPYSETGSRDTPNLEDAEVRVYFERQRFELEQSQLSSNRFQSEESPLSSNRFRIEQSPLSSNRFQTDQSATSSNSFELLNLGSNGSQIENFHLMHVPYLDLTYRVNDACETVPACDGDFLVSARMEFSPTLVNLQCFLRLLPSMHKCRNQLSDNLTPLYHDDGGNDWLSDEEELDFDDETGGDISSTHRPTNPVAHVLCSGGSEHFLPVRETVLDRVFHG